MGRPEPSWCVGGKYPASLGLPSPLQSPGVLSQHLPGFAPVSARLHRGRPTMAVTFRGEGSTSWPHRVTARNTLAHHSHRSLTAPHPAPLLAHIRSLEFASPLHPGSHYLGARALTRAVNGQAHRRPLLAPDVSSALWIKEEQLCAESRCLAADRAGLLQAQIRPVSHQPASSRSSFQVTPWERHPAPPCPH